MINIPSSSSNLSAVNVTETIENNAIPGNTHTNRENIQSMFRSTTCYDIMQNSFKAVVFEMNIPFQLAFYAMVENETEVAPLYDPEKRVFTGLITTNDYIHALRVCIQRQIPMIDLATKSISDVFTSPIIKFIHPYFEPLEAEEAVIQLCRVLYQSKCDFVPIIDPLTGKLVSTLGYMDIVHLMDTASRQYPSLFSDTLDRMNLIGKNANQTVVLGKKMKIFEVLNFLEVNNIAGAPVIDENGRVFNYYHKSDVTFITKASDPESVLVNLQELTLGEVLSIRESLIASGESLVTTKGLVTCSITDTVSAILTAMMIFRVTKIVVVDNNFTCIGVISIKDILAYYLMDDNFLLDDIDQYTNVVTSQPLR